MASSHSDLLLQCIKCALSYASNRLLLIEDSAYVLKKNVRDDLVHRLLVVLIDIELSLGADTAQLIDTRITAGPHAADEAVDYGAHRARVGLKSKKRRGAR